MKKITIWECCFENCLWKIQVKSCAIFVARILLHQNYKTFATFTDMYSFIRHSSTCLRERQAFCRLEAPQSRFYKTRQTGFFSSKKFGHQSTKLCVFFPKVFFSQSKCLHLRLYIFVANSTFETDKQSVIYLYEYIMQYMS